MQDDVAILRIIYGDHERTDVEYKRSAPWSGNTRYKLIKAMLAMSNAGGGYIIIGYDEKGTDKETRAAGVLSEHRDSWQVTNVSRDLNNHCSPPLDVDVLQLLDPERQVTFIVLRVPPNASVPHISTKDHNDSKGNLVLRRGALYYRNKNKSCEEIADSHDWQDLIRRCTLNKRNELLGDFERIIKGQENLASSSSIPRDAPLVIMDRLSERAVKWRPDGTEHGAFRELLFLPSSKWSERPIEVVNNALANSCYDHRGWPYLFYLPTSSWAAPKHGDGCIQAYSNEPFASRPLFFSWIFRYTTGEFYSQDLTTESSVGNAKCIDPKAQVELLAEALRSVGLMYEMLETSYDELIETTLRLTGVNGAKVASVSSDFRIFESSEYVDFTIVLTRRIPLSSLVNSAAKEAAETMNEIIRRMGYNGSIRQPQLEQYASEFLQKGHKVSA